MGPERPGYAAVPKILQICVVTMAEINIILIVCLHGRLAGAPLGLVKSLL